MPDWMSIFELTVPFVELVVRGSITYLAILCLLRLFGQREAGGLGVTDVLLIVLVAEASAPGIYGDAESVGDALVIIITLLAWSAVIDVASYKWPSVGRKLKGRQRILIQDGKLNHKVARRELMTADEIESILRLHGIDNVSSAKRVNIEPNGMISVQKSDGEGTETPEPPVSIR